MRPTIALVEGTWGGDAWAQPMTPFRRLLDRLGFDVGPEFCWTEDVSGIPHCLTMSSRKHSDWRAGGFALALYLEKHRIRRVLAHSHGGPVVAYACAAFGAEVDRLVTVATPPRSDVDPVWEQARPRLGYWLHVTDERSDFMQFLGGLTDGHWGRVKVQCRADRNVTLPGIAHSRLLREPQLFVHWPMILNAFVLPDEQLARDKAVAHA